MLIITSHFAWFPRPVYKPAAPPSPPWWVEDGWVWLRPFVKLHGAFARMPCREHVAKRLLDQRGGTVIVP